MRLLKTSRRSKCQTLIGQAATEFAMALPIAMALLALIILVFRTHDSASVTALEDYSVKLRKFEHGNGLVQLDGYSLPSGSYIDLLPFDSSSNLGDLLINMAAKTALDIGLREILSNLKFMDGETYWSGALREGTVYASTSFFNSGFRSIDWDGVPWAAAAGALASQQATLDFQGDQFSQADLREALGSALQGSAIGLAQSQGDLTAATTGALSGLLGSDTSKFLDQSDWDVLAGAAKGALEGAIVGMTQGDVNFETIATSAGLGAFRTRTVADLIPLTEWSGDPRQSTMFNATNAAVAAMVSGGKSKDVLMAATSGAFFSGQTMQSMGDSKWAQVGAGAAFGAATSIASGQANIEAIGASTIQYAAASLALSKMAQLQQQLYQKALNAVSKAEVASIFEARATHTQAVMSIQTMISPDYIEIIQDALVAAESARQNMASTPQDQAEADIPRRGDT